MGNNFVTSAIHQRDCLFLIKLRCTSRMTTKNENFRTKIEIAFEEIIGLLEVPKIINLYIVFDSWWFSSDLFNKCLKLGNNIVCQIHSDKKVGINQTGCGHPTLNTHDP
jgi:hypothetical protein